MVAIGPRNSSSVVSAKGVGTGSHRDELSADDKAETMNTAILTVDAELEKLQHDTFEYFLHETNAANGLVVDKTAANWPASYCRHWTGVGVLPGGR